MRSDEMSNNSPMQLGQCMHGERRTAGSENNPVKNKQTNKQTNKKSVRLHRARNDRGRPLFLRCIRDAEEELHILRQRRVIKAPIPLLALSLAPVISVPIRVPVVHRVTPLVVEVRADRHEFGYTIMNRSIVSYS